jgi:hypothetical protein
LNAGATDSSSLTVGIDTSSAGHKSGTATISLASDGTGTSGFAALAIGTQTVNVSGDVYRLASASTDRRGAVRQRARRRRVATRTLSLTNTALADGFSEGLDAVFGGVSDTRIQTSGSVSGLAAGATDAGSLVVSLDTSHGGQPERASRPLQFTSNGAGTSGLGLTAIGSQNVGVSTNVAVWRLAEGFLDQRPARGLRRASRR